MTVYYSSSMTPRPKTVEDSEILAAALRVVSRLGPSLTLADVGEEIGLSPATILQRFGSKRGLLLALFRSGAGVDDCFVAVRESTDSPLAALIAPFLWVERSPQAAGILIAMGFARLFRFMAEVPQAQLERALRYGVVTVITFAPTARPGLPT